MALTTALLAPVRAHAARSCLYYEFVKDTNVHSDLNWRYVDDYGRCIRVHNYRAGSGTTTDPCQINKGWLPNGWYDLSSSGPTGHADNYSGSTIWGRVWHLQDKKCHDGTWRTELFIHTEETSSNGQQCTSDPDDPKCWDDTSASPGGDPGTNDFKSHGCIKVRRQSPEESWPDAMSDVPSDWHDIGGLGHGQARADSVYVRS